MKNNCVYLLVLTLLACSEQSNEKVEDQVVFVNDQDHAMNEAITQAKNTLEDFLVTAANPPEGAEGFKLKVKVTDEHGVEHLWFKPFVALEKGYEGLLVNEPQRIKSMTHGNTYKFKENQITDWGYTLNGKQIGSFTVCALFLTMDQVTVDQYKSDHGFICD